MYRRAESERDGGAAAGPEAGADRPASEGSLLPAFQRPEPAGDLDRVLDHRPIFRRRVRGYDRFQVDNYVAWAETEVEAARRQCDYLLSRYGACAAELELIRRTPVRSVTGPVSVRLGQMLRLAAEEAEAITAAGVDEAERIVAEARAEAEARLGKVAGIREAALAAGEELRGRARRDAAQLLRNAAAERDAAATEAARQLSAVRAEVEDLRRQRDEARQSLHRLTAQIGQALEAVAAAESGDLAVLPDRHPIAS